MILKFLNFTVYYDFHITFEKKIEQIKESLGNDKQAMKLNVTLK